MTSHILVNGEEIESINVNNRGLAFGDGLFETINVYDSRPEFYSLHRARLQNGCERLNIPCDLAAVDEDVKRLMDCLRADRGILKLMVTRGFTARGYAPGSATESDRIVMFSENTTDYAQDRACGIPLGLCETPLSENPVLSGLKHLARLENVLASAELTDLCCDEGIMLDLEGFVVEGTRTNVFIVANRSLLTPPLERSGIKGIIRELILSRLAPALELSTQEQKLTVDDLCAADEIFVCNSVMGIVPVSLFHGCSKTIGPLTRMLQKALQDEIINNA